MLQEAVGCGDQKQMVGQLVGKVGHLETALAEAERQRRTLHNTLVGIRGNIRVFCRLKPCRGTTAVTPIHGDGVRAVVEGKPHDFYFDRCAARGCDSAPANWGMRWLAAVLGAPVAALMWLLRRGGVTVSGWAALPVFRAMPRDLARLSLCDVRHS